MKLLDSVQPQQVNLNSFKYKNILNTKIWHKGTLNPIVRKRLLSIAVEFYKTLETTIIPNDIIIVGSLANYNWSKYSDIDLHLVIDFSKINKNVDLVRNFFILKKNDWNSKHENLTIYNFPVETYVQDINEENAAEGVFSLKYNRWIKFPKGGTLKMNEELIKTQAAKLINTIEYYEKKANKFTEKESLEVLSHKVNLLYDLIKNSRKIGLSKEGEGSLENIVFKTLRRSGHLARLNNLRIYLYDKINSL